MSEIRKAIISAVVDYVRQVGTARSRSVTRKVSAREQCGSEEVVAAVELLVRQKILGRPEKGKVSLTRNFIDAAAAGIDPLAKLPEAISRMRTKKRKPRKADWKAEAFAQVRKANNYNPSQNVRKIINKLPDMEPDKLANIWKNAVKNLAEGKIEKSARLVLEAVEKEWARRSTFPPDQWFKWPGTEAKKGSGGLLIDNPLGEGMLSYLEYRVGRISGQATPVRQAILDRVFASALPPVFPKEYMDSWGESNSASRLRKMAETIAAFARNAKRRDDDRLDEAIRQWESDLEYLHDRYYVGRFGFGWPTTSIIGQHRGLGH